MTPDELQEKIDELEEQLQEETKKRETLEDGLEEVKELLSEHGHTNEDGSKRIRSTIEVAQGEYVGIGPVAGMLSNYLKESVAAEQDQLGIVIGKDKDATDGSENAQLAVQHYRNNSLTFFLGTRPPTYLASDGILKTDSTLKTGTYTFKTDELAGAYIDIRQPDRETSIGIFQITSNTTNTITFSGTITADVENAYFFIFQAMYLGAGSIPWRRIYVVEGTGGGYRFGTGATGDGNNGLLYMDSAGDLYWRNKANTAVKLN